MQQSEQLGRSGQRVYKSSRRPPVEVLVDGAWRTGELCAWFLRDGEWWANVSWDVGAGHHRRSTVCSDEVRSVTRGEDADIA